MTVTEPSPPGDGRAERPVAVVTGANRGIGRDVARQLAGHGFVVIAGARDPGQGERTARQLDPAGGTVIALRLDVTDPATIEAAAGWTAGNLGRADVLVNNAAIHYDTWQQARNADLGVVREALDTNLLGAWRTTQAFLPPCFRTTDPPAVSTGTANPCPGDAPAPRVPRAH